MPRAVYTSSGTFTPEPGVTEVDVLVVAGGGSGGGAGSGGGGGGAGGVIVQQGVAVTPGVPVTVTVGAGGAAITSTPNPGNPGGNSAFGDIVAVGGGRGGGGNGNPPSVGGSGGGGGGQSSIPSGAAGTPGQGHAGGDGVDGLQAGRVRGGGGGGAGEAGHNGGNNGVTDAGKGGDGIYVGDPFGDDIGVSGWVGGGGGGGRHGLGTGNPNIGGAGGGGDGGTDANGHGAAGVDGTGGGGGGGGMSGSGSTSSTAGLGGKGGDGVVVVMWEEPPPVEPASGSATFEHTWDVTATGTAPDVDGGHGSATVEVSWDVAASGSRPSSGSVELAHTWTVEAAGYAPAADPVQITGASAASLTSPSGRAGKGQRWAWWTGARWDGVLPTSSGWRIYTGLGNSTPTAGPVVDNRQAARATAVADGDSVWILRGHTSTPRITRYTRSGTTYTADGSVTDVAITALAAADGDASPVTLHRTPGGRLWASVVAGGSVVVAVSDNDGATWSSSTVASVSDTGVAALAHSGTTLVLMVTLNAGAGRLVRTHALTGSIASGWSSESLPSLPSGVTSDDHGHATTDGSTIYWASKTEGPSSVQPLLYLLRRTAAGTWTSHTLVTGPDEGVRPTRPAIALTSTHVHVTWGQIRDPQAIQYTAVPRADLSTVPPPVTLFGDGNFSDGAITPGGVLTHPSGILLLAHDRDDGDIWQVRLPVPAPPSGSATIETTWGLTATGTRPTRGSATLAHTWSVDAAGSRASAGTVEAAHTWDVTATGSRPSTGTVQAAHTWDVTATGSRASSGSAELGHTWDLTAIGRAPGVDERHGSAAFEAAWDVEATGSRPSTGAATLSYGWDVEAAGSRTSAGSATLAHTWGVQATGSAPDPDQAAGSAELEVTWSLAATGSRSSTGTADIHVTWTLAAHGPGQAIAPPERTLLVPAAYRRYDVEPAPRTLTIPASRRVMEVT